MEIFSSYNRIELEQMIYDAVQKALNNLSHALSRETQEEPEEIDFEGFLRLTGYCESTGYKKVNFVPHAKRGGKLIFYRKEVTRWLESITIRKRSLLSQAEDELSKVAKAKE